MSYPYPIFEKRDARRQDGDVEASDFIEFLDSIIDAKEVEGVELGIAKFAAANGTAALSENQHYHLKQIVDRYNSHCDVCGSEIPYSDRFVLTGETNSCSVHYRP